MAEVEENRVEDLRCECGKAISVGCRAMIPDVRRAARRSADGESLLHGVFTAEDRLHATHTEDDDDVYHCPNCFRALMLLCHTNNVPHYLLPAPHNTGPHLGRPLDPDAVWNPFGNNAEPEEDEAARPATQDMPEKLTARLNVVHWLTRQEREASQELIAAQSRTLHALTHVVNNLVVRPPVIDLTGDNEEEEEEPVCIGPSQKRRRSI